MIKLWFMPAGTHSHLINISDLSKDEINALLDTAQRYHDQLESGTFQSELLKGMVILTLFFENSTRTKISFEIAAKRLGAEVVNWDISTSSMSKGEDLMDTVQTLGAMRPDAVIIRSADYNAAHYVSTKVDCPVINAGDSYRAHPTQALLDALTIRQSKGKIEGLNIAICGDIAHSRVANSNLVCLDRLSANIRVIAPDFLMPEKFPIDRPATYTSLEEGLKGCDVVMMLRNQKERMQAGAIPDDVTFFRDYGLTRTRLSLCQPDVIIMHPGPMNRGVEIAEDLPDDPKHSVILKQVANGIPMRMAVLVRSLDKASK